MNTHVNLYLDDYHPFPTVITGEFLMQIEQFFSYIMARTSYIQWNDDARCLPDQHA